MASGSRVGVCRAAMDPRRLKERDVPRLQAAAADGLHGAFAFPVSVGREVLGVFEFCSRGVRRPDDDLLWMFNAIGAQVGQFLARKGMEQQIHESEARKAGMLNGALDCVITVDQSGVIVEFNPAAERTFGYRSGEVIGQLFIDVLIPAGTSRSLPGADGAIPRVGTRHVHRPAARGRRHARGWHKVSG